MHEDLFRYSKDPIMQRVWKERIEPYIDEPIYTVTKIDNVATSYISISTMNIIYIYINVQVFVLYTTISTSFRKLVVK